MTTQNNLCDRGASEQGARLPVDHDHGDANTAQSTRNAVCRHELPGQGPMATSAGAQPAAAQDNVPTARALTAPTTYETPSVRMDELGVGALSARELLAVVLRGAQGETNALAQAHAILDRTGTLIGLARSDLTELAVAVPGLTKTRRRQLAAALELGRRVDRESLAERPQIASPADAGRRFALDFGNAEQEEVHVMCLDSRRRIITTCMVYRGTICEVNMRMAELLRPAIRNNARSIIIGHNHPGGDPAPSEEDTRSTRRIAEACMLLGVPLLDHLVVAGNAFVSLKESGIDFD